MIGPDPMISMAQLEQAILARTFFEPGCLLIVDSRQDSRAIDGWCLTYRDPESATSASVCAVCLSSASDDSAGDQLIDAVESQMVANAVQQVHAGVVRDRQFGLAGLSPIGHGIGVPMLDLRMSSILQQRNYDQQRGVQRMTAMVAGFRPPVSRDSMQLRRTSERSFSDYLHPTARGAAAMSHLNIETHCLIDRAGTELSRLNLWFSDAEAEVMSPSQAILDLTEIRSDDGVSAADSYLIGSVVQSLGSLGIASVETAVDMNQPVRMAQLEALGFTAGDQGIEWVKRLGD